MIDFHRRANPSLLHAGLQPLVRELELPRGARGTLRIAGYSDALPVEGAQRSLTPTLNWSRLALLREPVETQLIVELDGGEHRAEPLELLPMSAFSHRARDASAAAVFVFEGCPAVHQLVGFHRSDPDAIASDLPMLQRAERAFDALCRAGLRYHFELGLFSDHEQAVRFPRQILEDGGFGGGTCVDIALLFSAMLLRIECNPVLCVLGDEFGDRHVVVGVATPAFAARSTVVTASELGAAIEADAIVPIDVNVLAYSRDGFGDALAEGRLSVRENGLLWGVDIEAARMAGVRPFPVEPGFRASVQPADEVTEARTAAATVGLSGYRLRIVESIVDTDRGRVWELADFDRARVRVGRGASNEIQLTDVMVSRVHAALTFLGGHVSVIDLGSLGGTFVDGHRLQPFEPTTLGPQSYFSLGGSENVVMSVEVAPDRSPPDTRATDHGA